MDTTRLKRAPVHLVQMRRPISVLFVRRNSTYFEYDDIEVYTARRNALTFDFQSSIIAHPPCRLWSKMSHFSNADPLEKTLGIYAINAARIVGGIVEHPAGSRLFKYMDCGTPSRPDAYGGYIISINQSWFGHPCQKRTYLYICGLPYSDIPPITPNFSPHTHTVGSATSKTKLIQASQRIREYTPPALCEWLISTARMIQERQKYLFGT